MAIVHCFISAGSEVEVKEQKIQTEINETVAGQKHVQTGSVTSPLTSISRSSVYTFQFGTAILLWPFSSESFCLKQLTNLAGNLTMKTHSAE